MFSKRKDYRTGDNNSIPMVIRFYKGFFSLSSTGLREFINIIEQEMSNDTYAPLTLTFDLVTPNQKGSSNSHDQSTCEI